MGILSRTITTTATSWQQNVDSFEIFEGILYSVTLLPLVGDTEGSDAFAEISIMDGAESVSHRSASLVSGYFGSINPLGWTGRHPIITENRIAVVWRAEPDALFKLQWLQLMPSADLSSKQVLDA